MGVVRVANAQGFWGDAPGAAARLVAQVPDLDYLTLDYLAEVTLSILARQRERDATGGYARDFVDTLRSLLPAWARAPHLRLITNAGGLNPRGCAEACARLLGEAGWHGRRIGVVAGDDVLPEIREAAACTERAGLLANLDSGRPLSDVLGRLVTANAYLGAEPLAAALEAGAELVVSGRVADPSLTVAACRHHHGWSWSNYDRLAGATVAGHLIECGTQVTGGISTNWLDVPDPAHVGYPIVEVDEAGTCVVTKPPGSGGRVSEQTVKEQLLYEIGDPDAYLSPDATVSFLGLRVEDLGGDRVRVSGARGRPAPPTLKVSATYRAGYRASGTLTIAGRHAPMKARRCGEIVLARLREADCAPADALVECLGAGIGAPHDDGGAREVVLRLSVADERRETVEAFTRELVPLVTCGPQGTTGYAEGRPRVHEVFGYWPCLLPRERVAPAVEVIET
jgi:hypothetical protein